MGKEDQLPHEQESLRVAIDRGRTEDLEKIDQLQAIEDDAGELFRDVGLEDVADMDGVSAETFVTAIERGDLFVARVEEMPVGFALLRNHRPDLHLQELAVRREFGRRGIGTSLLSHVEQHARREAFDRITLTTFLDVAWNAPFYERYGFRNLEHNELDERLSEVLRLEEQLGLDVRRRVCMALYPRAL